MFNVLMKGEWLCTTPSSFDRAWEAYSMLKRGLCLGLAGPLSRVSRYTE